MANKLNKDEVSLVEELVKQFDSDNTVAKQAEFFTQAEGSMQRQGDTVWRDVPMISTTVSGLDITGKIGDVGEFQVPATLSNIENVPWQLNALELRDPSYRTRKAKSGAQALSAYVNRAMANKVHVEGSLVVSQSTMLAGYDDVSLCEALMLENDISDMEKTMVLAPRDYNRMSGDLAKRTLMGRSEKALSESELGRIAGFDMFRSSFAPTVSAAGGGATAVAGTQRYVPAATSVASTGEESKVDNRFMNLTVDNTAGVAAGDKFTIPGVNAVSHINKNDTGQLKTFTVKEVVNGTTLKIAPAIIVGDGNSKLEDDYANCSAPAADTSALTWLNTTAAQSNIFFTNDSIEVFGGNLVFDAAPNVAVERMTTDSGIEILFARSSDVLTGKTTYRLTIFFGVTNKHPEKNGILIGGQS